jgi:hypothetical protein
MGLDVMVTEKVPSADAIPENKMKRNMLPAENILLVRVKLMANREKSRGKMQGNDASPLI